MKWLHFILSHSIFIALCAAALSYQTALLLQQEHDIFTGGFIFFATLCSYNVYWLLSKRFRSTIHTSRGFLQEESGKFILLLIAAAGMLICFNRSGLDSRYIWPSVLLTVLYTVPLLPLRSLRFTRRFGVVKTCLLAFTWTYVTAFIPLRMAPGDLDAAALFIISRRFLFMLVLCIIFDSRDSAMDKIRGLHSLATDLTPAALRIFVIGLFLVLFASNFFAGHYGISLAQCIALQVSTLMLLLLYYLSLRKQGYFFYYFCVDGLMLFSALATYIASI